MYACDLRAASRLFQRLMRTLLSCCVTACHGGFSAGSEPLCLTWCMYLACQPLMYLEETPVCNYLQQTR